jgi:hypothetical protein
VRAMFNFSSAGLRAAAPLVQHPPSP